MQATDHASAVIQRIRRGVVPGSTTIGDLATLFDGANSIRDEHVTLVTALTGKVPVIWSPNDTTTAISLPGGGVVLYLTLAGRLSKREIVDALRGTSPNRQLFTTVIRDIGFWPDPSGK